MIHETDDLEDDFLDSNADTEFQYDAWLKTLITQEQADDFIESYYYEKDPDLKFYIYIKTEKPLPPNYPDNYIPNKFYIFYKEKNVLPYDLINLNNFDEIKPSIIKNIKEFYGV